MKALANALISLAFVGVATTAQADGVNTVAQGAAAVGGLLDALTGKGSVGASNAPTFGNAVDVPEGTAGFTQDLNRGVKFIAAVMKEEKHIIIGAEAIGGGKRSAFACEIIVQQGGQQATVAVDDYSVKNNPGTRVKISKRTAQHECINDFYGIVSVNIDLPFWYDPSKPIKVIWPNAKASFNLH